MAEEESGKVSPDAASSGARVPVCRRIPIPVAKLNSYFPGPQEKGSLQKL